MDRELWNTLTRPDGRTMREGLKGMGRDGYDIDRLINSELGDIILEQSRFLYENKWPEGSQEVRDYWEKKGLRKEFHDSEVYLEKWASYVPVSAFDPANRDRKYPLIFLLHGGALPIYQAEIYGFNDLAAEKEIILIMPQDRAPETVKKLYDMAVAEMPVDTERVYVAGFSAGGGWTMTNAHRQPELFAAAAPCGVHVMQDEEGFPVSEEWRLEKYPMPFITVVGEEEGTNVLPYNRDDPPKKNTYTVNTLKAIQRNHEMGLERPNRGGTKPSTAEAKIALLNRRLRLAGCEQIPFDDCVAAAESDNIVNRKIGAVCQETEDRFVHGQHHYIGSFYNKEGGLRFRAVCVENVPHTAHYSMAEIVWEFFCRFRRAADGSLIEEK